MLDPAALSPDHASVTDIDRYRRRSPGRDSAADSAGMAPASVVLVALLDDQLAGDGKLLVACWAAMRAERPTGDETACPASILDAARMATGLRGLAALKWVASAVAADAQRPDPALPRYIDADWARLQQWATNYDGDGVEQRHLHGLGLAAHGLDRVGPQFSDGHVFR